MTLPKSHQGKRTTSSEETRARILKAARGLAVEEGFSSFTVQKVAERAGVSRLTVYYQFGSKSDLLEKLFDHLAARGRMDLLPEAFKEPDSLDALRKFIEVFCEFWASDLVGIMRLRSWAALEPGFEETGRGRDAWQRQGLEVLLRRIRDEYSLPAGDSFANVLDLLHVLLSPESYEKLSRSGRSKEEISALLNKIAREIIGLGQ
jgi:AcrR family transcriptional regulator